MEPTNSSRIPWPRIFAEGLAIVGSILLAFAIQAWWEGAQDRAQEARALESLATDFEANLSSLRATIALHEAAMERNWRLSTLDSATLGGLPSDSVGDYLRATWMFNTFNSQNATVDELIASGNLGVLREPRLRQLLVKWQNGVEDLEENSRLVLSAGESGLRRITELGGPWHWTGVLSEQLPVDATAYRALLDPRLRGLARLVRTQSQGYLFELAELKADAEEVSQLLAELRD